MFLLSQECNILVRVSTSFKRIRFVPVKAIKGKGIVERELH